MLSRSPFAGVVESAGEAYRALGRSSVVPPQVLFAPRNLSTRMRPWVREFTVASAPPFWRWLTETLPGPLSTQLPLQFVEEPSVVLTGRRSCRLSPPERQGEGEGRA